MTEHNRREEYWEFYNHAVVAETAHLRRTLIRRVREKPCPRSEGNNRGRSPIHSKEKLDFACLWNDGPQPDVPQDRIGDGGDAHPVGRRACARPHHSGQAHADHPARMDGRDTGPRPPAAAWPRPAGRMPRWEQTAAGRRPPDTRMLSAPTRTRATLPRSPRKVSTGSTISRPSWGCRSY